MYERWQTYEIDFIREVAGSLSTEEIAGKLERTTGSIRYMAQRAGVNLDQRNRKPWTKRELRLFRTHTNRQIANKTGRSIGAVQYRRWVSLAKKQEL